MSICVCRVSHLIISVLFNLRHPLTGNFQSPSRRRHKHLHPSRTDQFMQMKSIRQNALLHLLRHQILNQHPHTKPHESTHTTTTYIDLGGGCYECTFSSISLYFCRFSARNNSFRPPRKFLIKFPTPWRLIKYPASRIE